MGLLIAPYNTAMRLGQGFNSYTQEICIDDAVIIDPGRPLNALTNDGSTMLDLRQSMKGDSPYSAIKDLSPTECELLGISEPADAEHDPDPVLDSDTEAPPVGMAKPLPTPRPNPQLPADNSDEDSDAPSQQKPAAPVKKPTAPLDSDDDSDAPSQQKPAAPVKKPTPPSDSDDDSEPETKPRETKKGPAPPLDDDSDAEPVKNPVKPVAGDSESETEAPKEITPIGPVAGDSDSETEAPKKVTPVFADSSDSEAGKKTTVVKKPAAPGKKIPAKKPATAKPLTKEQAAAARKKEAFDKKRVEDDEKQHAARERARLEADERQKRADLRAREAASIKPYTKAERDALFGALTKQVELAEKETAASKLKAIKTRQYERKATGARGPSQIVTYTSSFIDKLSEITDDMNISGALSIKYGTIGGSGRGAFVNSEKFKDSDLNFYISVKVVNQTVNIRDALVYQPLRTVDSSNFRQVYGDSFISGFIEGGEFNAIVSMKVLNKAQIMNIEAEAKVALTVGVADISAEAAVKVAKKNISNNTETTIMVSWSGGGFIKPIDEPWDIESLTSAAARFPDLVAITPQRTYAILTKYETLRSFMKLKPASFSKLAYENAQMYTNTLLDVYMDYKNLHKKIEGWMFDIENKISKLAPNSAWKITKTKKAKDDSESDDDDDDDNDDEEDVKPRRNKKSGSTGASYQALAKTGPAHDLSRFPVTLGGLDMAKKGCRMQMTRIVNEVDAITADPSLATIEDRPEPFMPVRMFKERMPEVVRIVKRPAVPLRLEKIQPGLDRQYPGMCPDFEHLEDAERLSVTELERERPTMGRFFRLAKPVGSAKNGTPFNNVDFLRYDTYVTAVHVEVYKGVVSYIEMTYSNGLVTRHGGQYDRSATKVVELKNLGQHERLIAATVETGKDDNSTKIETAPPPEPRITRLKLYTNRGRQLVAEDAPGQLDDMDINPVDKRGLRSFIDLNVTHFDPIMDNSFIKGFWGYSKNGPNGRLEDGIWRLGVIWGNNLTPEVPPTSDDEEETDTEKDEGKKTSGKKK